jgi:hypothetical protein
VGRHWVAPGWLSVCSVQTGLKFYTQNNKHLNIFVCNWQCCVPAI